MAHFAELDINNKVLRVLVACNQDIADHGGELSEEAANYFGSYTPFSENGVKWVQTSYNNNFRKRFAGANYTYDSINDVFIPLKPHNSWILDNLEYDWKSTIPYPSITTYGDNVKYNICWDEDNLRWLGITKENQEFYWETSLQNWLPK